MGGKTRDRLWGDRVRAGKVRVEATRRRAAQAAREADAAACRLWSDTMEGFGGPAQPSPTIEQCLSGGYGLLEVRCKRCRNRVSIPLEYVRRPRDTPIWKLESATIFTGITWNADDIVEAVKADAILQIALAALVADVLVGWVWLWF